MAEEANRGDEEAFKAIRQRYHDRFSGLTGKYALEKIRNSYPFLRGYKLPEVEFERSKITGDFAPRQSLWEGYLSFDTEKYREGEPARDLSLMVEEAYKKFDRETAEKIVSDISEIVGDRNIIHQMERSIIGYLSERTPNAYSKRDERLYKDLLKMNLEFYDGLKPSKKFFL